VFCARDAGNINVKIPCFADNREVAPLHLAAENGHVETVIALLDQFKADISLRDSDGNTALQCVVLQAYHPYRMRDRDFFYATAKVTVTFSSSVTAGYMTIQHSLSRSSVLAANNLCETMYSMFSK